MIVYSVYTIKKIKLKRHIMKHLENGCLYIVLKNLEITDLNPMLS